MGRSIIIHKKKDGTVTLDGDAPDTLVISTGLIAQGASEGHITTDVTYHFNIGDVTYRILEASLGDADNPDSPITGYKLAKVSDSTKKAKAGKASK